MDDTFDYVGQINATAGICFGFCMLAFLNIIALTPKPKRGLPLYAFNLRALASLAARYLTVMVSFTALEPGAHTTTLQLTIRTVRPSDQSSALSSRSGSRRSP